MSFYSMVVGCDTFVKNVTPVLFFSIVTDISVALIETLGVNELSSMDTERARIEFPALDPQESDTETKPEEPHWVAELFRPHFTVLDLLEGSDGRPRQQEPSSLLQMASEKENQERSRRVQEIYRSALREVQLRENLQRERLSKMTVREGESEETDPKLAGHKGRVSSQSEDEDGGKEEEEQGEKCIWNAQDLSALRRAAREVELDRRRLRAELREARAEAGEQRAERRRLQALLDEREEQLGRAKRAAAQRELRLDALRAEACGRDAQLEGRAAEARDGAQEAQRAAAGTRKAEEEAREARRESAGLVRELERLRRQREEEGRRQAEMARVEREAALQGLQRELLAVRAELAAEKQSHARSRTALELLRRHFTGHPPRETRESSTNRISYI